MPPKACNVHVYGWFIYAVSNEEWYRQITHNISYWVSNDMLRSGIDILRRSFSEFAWIYWIKSRTTSNKTVGFSTEVGIRHLPKENQKIWCFIHFLSNKIKYRHVPARLSGLFQKDSKTQEVDKNWQFKQIIVRWLKKLVISVYFRPLLPCMNVTFSAYILSSAELNI